MSHRKLDRLTMTPFVLLMHSCLAPTVHRSVCEWAVTIATLLYYQNWQFKCYEKYSRIFKILQLDFITVYYSVCWLIIYIWKICVNIIWLLILQKWVELKRVSWQKWPLCSVNAHITDWAGPKGFIFAMHSVWFHNWSICEQGEGNITVIFGLSIKANLEQRFLTRRNTCIG